MSPEQARDPRQVDTRTDIWSLGLILHELLTGRPAFRAKTRADVLALVLLKDPPPISSLRPDVPLEIERVIQRCLQKLPEYRFSTVRALAAQLLPFAAAAAGTDSLHCVGSGPVPAPERDPAAPVSRTFSASAPSPAAPAARWRRVDGREVRFGWSAPLRHWSRCPGFIGSGPSPCSAVRRRVSAGWNAAGRARTGATNGPNRRSHSRKCTGASRVTPKCCRLRGQRAPHRLRAPLSAGAAGAPTPAGAGALGSASRPRGGGTQSSSDRHTSASPSSRPTLTAVIDSSSAGDDSTEDDPLNARK